MHEIIRRQRRRLVNLRHVLQLNVVNGTKSSLENNVIKVFQYVNLQMLILQVCNFPHGRHGNDNILGKHPVSHLMDHSDQCNSNLK